MSIAARENDVRICDLLCHGANAPVAANVPQKGPFPIQRGPPGLREGQKGPVPAAEGLAFIQCWSIGARTYPNAMQIMRRRKAKCSSTAADIRIRQIAVVRTITTVISVICSILIVRGMISSIATIGCENNAINRHWFHPKWTTSIQKGPEGLKGASTRLP